MKGDFCNIVQQQSGALSIIYTVAGGKRGDWRILPPYGGGYFKDVFKLLLHPYEILGSRHFYNFILALK